MKAIVAITIFYTLVRVVTVSPIFRERQIAYFIRPFDESEITVKKRLAFTSTDTVITDSIYMLLSEDGMPLAYSADIHTTVCANNECLPVEIEIFWGPTGAYLGFKLPNGMPLTKEKHIPFSEDEYTQLNKLLANKQSVLLDYEPDELVTPKKNNAEVDGISSATIKEIKNVIVPGAVYTCYQLYKIVNGPIAQFISQNTSKIMTPAFANLLVDSKRKEEIVWLLDRVSLQDGYYLHLKQKLVETINDLDYSISFRIRNCLTQEDLDDTVIQHLLLDAFISSNPVIQLEIMKKLGESNQLDEKLFIYFSKNLRGFNSNILIYSLQLLSKQNHVDPRVLDYVSELLTSKNKYLAARAWLFIEETSAISEKSQTLKKKYNSNFNQ
ncbi:hypothetical protein [Mariniphaga sediminis]|uniref:hypothetical protein n=1 Tax=Mariniphaga sediminis TaxID=1628158 RepID=UPI003567A408